MTLTYAVVGYVSAASQYKQRMQKAISAYKKRFFRHTRYIQTRETELRAKKA